MMKAIPVFAGACVLALAACAPMRWERPGVGRETVEKDLADCRRAALEEVHRASLHRGGLHPLVTHDIEGLPHLIHQPRVFAVPSARREHELVDVCMRTKGYRLVAVEETPAPESKPAK